MQALKVMELGRKYAVCPSCGSDKVGNGAGTIQITETTFKRACACGWSVHVNKDDEAVADNGEG